MMVAPDRALGSFHEILTYSEDGASALRFVGAAGAPASGTAL